ncbi:MAG: energy-dependent translational throttle protein EttA [Magnetovibrio sp.]|nr:energy-dependent translational throttle protein EttA [Magnetovibrio sp.]
MASYQYCYVMRDVRKTFPGGKGVLKGITLSFLPDAKIGLIGVNGAGKSTLLKIMAGEDEDFTGEAWAAEGVRVGYLEQEPKLQPELSVEENIMVGLEPVKNALNRFNKITEKFSEPMEQTEMDALLVEQGELQEKIDSMNGWEIERTIEIAMDALRCPPGGADIRKLSGGECRRVALCRLLLQQPEILLLDEPTNHLDAESVAWLERFLCDYKGMVLMVTHDRYFLDNVTGWILEIDRGLGIPYEGNYSSWLEQKEKRLLQEAREFSAQQRTLRNELEWIRTSPKARHAKAKARITAYETLVAKSNDPRSEKAQIVIPPAARLGNLVIDVKNLRKTFGSKLLVEDLSFKLPPGGIVGVIGPNGAGKTTLFRLITGQEKPDSGMVDLGETVQLGYIDQSRDSLDNKNTVWEEIADGEDEIELGKHKIQSRAFVSQFNFKSSDQQKLVGQLSGGERNRVHLAKMLKTGANVLLLDEPTNDLDIDTLRALEDSLGTFSGCALIVSHDRWFLDRLATHILAFEGNSQVAWFEGNYEAYEADRRKRLGESADRPSRIKYKPLTRQ